MKENKSRYVILGFLAHEPQSGYDIMKRIEASVAQFCDISYGQIYPELAKLEKLGLARLDEAEEYSGRLRKTYSITEKGRAELREWLAAPIRDEKLRYDILLKLFFGASASPEVTVATIRDFRTRCAARLTELMGFQQVLGRIAADSPDHVNYLMAVDFGLMANKTFVEWADLTLEKLSTAAHATTQTAAQDKESETK